ncbi:hypothetical protein FB45DRAFT_1082140 [Roridomyces roridus]|uniref:Uncharacterized protein n=1 Tax=Roridomyces roridus TaxID=1738132 RepID=A0AAD7FMB9_9AGAR|nr:hypothetical protein FB45DRAFT_1082140 [Roridomyces roridus]
MSTFHLNLTSSMADSQELARKVSATPMRYITEAYHQTPRGFESLDALTNVWSDVPETIELGVIDMFLFHLRAEKVPTCTPFSPQRHNNATCAYLSLDAMDCGDSRWLDWDRVLRILFVSPAFREAVVETPGSIELWTNLSIGELESLRKHDGVAIPSITLLNPFINSSAYPNVHARLLSAVDGDTNSFMRLLLQCTRRASKYIHLEQGPISLHFYIRLLNGLCRPTPHPLRRAFFDAGGIATVTRVFLAFSQSISSDPTEDQLTLLTSFITFISEYLEGDDYLGVVHAIKAGLPYAFLACLSTLLRLPQNSTEMAWDIVFKVLPAYMVYQSFRTALFPFVDDCHHERISLPSEFQSWAPFMLRLSSTFESTRRANEAFRRCENLQKLDWKAGHRKVCKPIEFDGELGRRRHFDILGIRKIAQAMVDSNFATLHAIALRDFPDTPHEDLVPFVDLTQYLKIEYKVTAMGADDEIAEASPQVGRAFVIVLIRNGSKVETPAGLASESGV